MHNDLDNKGSADKYVGGTLKAQNTVQVFSSPGGNVYKTIPAGGIIGTIESYVTDNGNVWWLLTDGKFVKHVGLNFDFPYLEQSIEDLQKDRQSEINEKVKERQEENTSTLYKLGNSVNIIKDFVSGNLGSLLLITSIIVILIIIIKLKK